MTSGQGCSFAGEYDILDLAYQIGIWRYYGQEKVLDNPIVFCAFYMSVSVAILPCGIINVHSLFGEITTYIRLTTVSTKRLFQKNCGIRCMNLIGTMKVPLNLCSL